MTKVKQAPDPWQRTTTENGFPADEVISALQKSIRRGLVENALLLGWEIFKVGGRLVAQSMYWAIQADGPVDEIATPAKPSKL